MQLKNIIILGAIFALTASFVACEDEEETTTEETSQETEETEETTEDTSEQESETGE